MIQYKPDHTIVLLEEHETLWSVPARLEVAMARQSVRSALRQGGYRVKHVQVPSPGTLPFVLRAFEPGACIIFNWYDGAEWGAMDAAHVAALLEDLGYTYTGSDDKSLLMAQDKTCTKQLLHAHGIPTPAWQRLVSDRAKDWNHFPAIVKVATEHGSEWLTCQSVVWDESELRALVAALRKKTRLPLMVSQFVNGREFTVSLLGNAPPQVLPLVEIDYSALPSDAPHLRTFAAKWSAHSPQSLLCPPRLPPSLQNRIEQVALDAYRALGLRDYGRIDLRLEGEEPQVIDVNANPDISRFGSFTLAAKHAGIAYGALLERIIQFARARTERIRA